MDVSVDASNELPPNIEPPNVLSVVDLEVIDDSVKCYLLIVGDWSLQVGDGRHNHDMEEVLKGHKIVGRLNPNESLYLHELTDSNIYLRKILTNLRKRNSKTSTNIKHIYNACHRYRQSIRGTRTDMQHLLKLLVEKEYMYHLFNTLPTVLVMGSIYKTNKYRLPLLEFVGNTSTEYMFSSGFGYMMYEKEDNVTWSYDRCSTALLCEHHIEKNVRAKCKTDCKVKDLKGKDRKEIKSSEVVKTVMVAWEDIVNSDTEQAYVDNCNRFKVVCHKFPKFVKYVENKILGSVKE
ncbi:hypothetical protein MTR_5g072970 [Medicago truncatula]|uniref:Uncharacterized protein n=1 Tax=Medicago truncatula TaxID=3880 RepID=G7KEE8_MEDTR|nr:hypothetical protein MTR_5g072970 [Medicago truncatula]